jgi:heme oxygenase (mycobilin-producing)
MPFNPVNPVYPVQMQFNLASDTIRAVIRSVMSPCRSLTPRPRDRRASSPPRRTNRNPVCMGSGHDPGPGSTKAHSARRGPYRSAMFVFISHLQVPEPDQAELERHFRERSRLVDGFPGFLYLHLLRPQAGESTHTFLTAWESRDAFRLYMRSREHAHSHSREPAEIMGRTSVRHEAYDVLMDSRKDPEWLRRA